MRALKWLAIGVLIVAVALVVAVRLTTYQPDDVLPEAVSCPEDAPTLAPGAELEVMTWNIQYLAGKDYVFFYDVLDGSGPDERPSAAAIARSLDEVVRVIEDEQPDVLLLQEVDDGADRTDGADQLQLLLDRLPGAYPCHASAFYWRATFVPHPRIMGSVGMKLSTLSRYRIDEATRHQLPRMPSDIVTRQFDLDRAILETRLPVEGASDLVVLNTHLDAFAQGTDTMQRQVALTADLLAELDAAGEPWVLGGDMNLLPPGRQYDDLPAAQRAYYEADSELAVLTDRYGVVPSLEEANGEDRASWFTHVPNDPSAGGLDRTIDFLLHADTLTLGDHRVRQDDTLDISDHLPVVATYRLPD